MIVDVPRSGNRVVDALETKRVRTSKVHLKGSVQYYTKKWTKKKKEQFVSETGYDDVSMPRTGLCFLGCKCLTRNERES